MFIIKNKRPDNVIVEIHIFDAVSEEHARVRFWEEVSGAVGSVSTDDGATWHEDNLYSAEEIAEWKMTGEFLS